MFLSCANPACRNSFEYKEGRLFRFQENPLDGQHPANGHSVRHFWLCGECSESYMLKKHGNRGVILVDRIGRACEPIPVPNT